VAAVAVAGLGYYATRSTSNQTQPSLTRTGALSPTLSAPAVDFEYKPSYINPTSADTVYFLNESRNPDGTDTDLTYSWYLDDRMVANTKDYSAQLSSQGIATPHKVRLSACRSAKCSGVEKLVEVDPDELYPARNLGSIRLKGVCYDAGINWDGGINSWRNLTDEQIERELVDVINRDLGCNAVRIEGDSDNVFRVADIAVRKASYDTIAISPRFISETVENTVTRLTDFAKKAEELRKTFEHIVLIVGNELPIDNRGVVSSAPTYSGRSEEIGKYSLMMKPESQNRLNGLLRRLVQAARQYFDGQITYASTWWEEGIKWESLDFDVISSNQYFDPRYNTEHDITGTLGELSRLKRVFITEFGSATFEGAFEAGGSGWDPDKYGNKKYSQEEQARAIEWYIKLLDRSRLVDGIFLANFMDICEDDRASFGIFRCKYLQSGSSRGWTKSWPERKLGSYMLKSFKNQR
jgi:hypothetical protein